MLVAFVTKTRGSVGLLSGKVERCVAESRGDSLTKDLSVHGISFSILFALGASCFVEKRFTRELFVAGL